MGLLNNLRKGSYKIFIKCSNCGFRSEVKVPGGVSVADFVKGGKCLCDNCKVVGFPEEYTTEHFEKEKKKNMNIIMKHDNVSKKEIKDIKWM